jgi:hypothetical protein
LNVVIDDHHARRILHTSPAPWLVELVGDEALYTTPRWATRLRSALAAPRGGTLLVISPSRNVISYFAVSTDYRYVASDSASH